MNHKYLPTVLCSFLMALTPFMGQAQSGITNGHHHHAQGVECASHTRHNTLLQTDPDYAARITANEAAIQNIIQNQSARSGSGVLTIPVVVHVIHTGQAVGTGANISMTQINSAIDALNDRFRKTPGTHGDASGVDVEIEFCLASRDPNCNATTGVVRVDGSGVTNYATEGITAGDGSGADEVAVKDLSRWPNTDYYNVWVVTEIEDNNGLFGIQGYAYFPGASSSVDGTVIMHTAFGTTGTVNSFNNLNRTFTHEVGHGLNLYHTFEGDNSGASCPSASNGCGSGVGDCCSDTEAHIRASSNCPTGTNACTGSAYAGVSNNYMNYSSQSCANMFTSDQRDRMRAALCGTRASLLTSLGCVAPGSPTIANASCSPNTTNLSNGFGIGVTNLTIGSLLDVTSSGAVNDGGYMDRTCNQVVELTANTTYSISVGTGSANNEDCIVYIDYNNDGDFDDAGEQIFADNVTSGSPVNATHSGSFTTPASVLTDTDLRLRVVSDWYNNSITGPCYAPTFGQVEDFAIRFPAGNTTQVTSSDCGTTPSGLDTKFYCDALTGVQTYEWRFINGGDTLYRQRGGVWNDMQFDWVSGIQYSTAYSVSIRVQIGGVWGSYGTACTVTTPSSPGTQLLSPHCNSTVSSFTEDLYCQAVPGATKYEWAFTNGGNTFTKERGALWTNMQLGWVNGVQGGLTYTVEIRAMVGGVWTSYGPSCNLTTPNTPTTTVDPADCGTTLLTFNDDINLVAASVADAYEWEFSEGANTFTRVRGGLWTNMRPAWVDGVEYGKTYSVRVRIQIGGTWGSYGSSCNITMPALPSVSVTSPSCGTTIASFTTTMTCTEIPGADMYEWRFVNGGNTILKQRGGKWNTMQLAWASGIQTNTTYAVRVRVNVGGTWGNFGPACNLTTPSSTRVGFFEDPNAIALDEDINPSLSIFPNPSGNHPVSIELGGVPDGEFDILVEVFDLQGKRMFVRQLASKEGDLIATINADGRLAKGMYIVRVGVGDHALTEKLIIQ